MPRLVVKVLDGYYGYPVEGAQVTLKAIGSRYNHTVNTEGPEGVAVFDYLIPRDYTISVLHPSLPYIPNNRGRVTLGNEDKMIEIKLLRPIELFIKDPDGNPIKNAMARVISIETSREGPFESISSIFYGPFEEIKEEGRIELLPPANTNKIRIEVCAPGYEFSAMTIPFDFRDIEESQNRLSLNITLKPRSNRTTR